MKYRMQPWKLTAFRGKLFSEIILPTSFQICGFCFFCVYISSFFLPTKQGSLPKSYFNISLEKKNTQMLLTGVVTPVSDTYHNIYSDEKQICSSKVWEVEPECKIELSDTALCLLHITLRTGYRPNYSIPYYHLLSTEWKLSHRRTIAYSCSAPVVSTDKSLQIHLVWDGKKGILAPCDRALVPFLGHLPASMTRAAEAVSPAYRENANMKKKKPLACLLQA